MLGLILAGALTIAVSGPPTSSEYLPLRVAEAEGLFAAEGLSVTLRATRAEPGAAEALAQGQVELAATSLDAVLRFGPRLPTQAPRLVFGLTAAPPVALLVPTAHQAIVRTLEDLRGTRVGVATPGAPEHAWFGWLLARAGLSVAHMWIVSRGALGVVQALEGGEVHAGLVQEPFASRLVAAGRAQVLVDFRTPGAVARAMGGPTVSAALFARADRLPDERALAALARALGAARRRVETAPPAELAARLPQRVTSPRDEFEARVEAARGVYLRDGLVTAEQVEDTLALVRAHLPLPAAYRVPRPEELLHLEALRRALSGAGPR
jgi:NitT/TauT family transport system substrate-binding protein